MFTMLQFASVWQVEYAYTTTCLVFHVHNGISCSHNASIRFCLTSGVCLAWYFIRCLLQFASVWHVEYAYTTTCLVFHVHDASIRFCLTSGVCLHDNMLGISCPRCFNSLMEYAYTSGVCLHDIMLGISCSQCFNSLLFNKWSMPTRQIHGVCLGISCSQFALCLTSGVCLHDNMLASQCFNSLLFNKWSMPTRQHAWYFMFTILQFASV